MVLGPHSCRRSRATPNAVFIGRKEMHHVFAELILVIILIIFLAGGFSGRFGGYGYGFGHGGVGLIGTILIIVVVLMLIGRV